MCPCFLEWIDADKRGGKPLITTTCQALDFHSVAAAAAAARAKHRRLVPNPDLDHVVIGVVAVAVTVSAVVMIVVVVAFLGSLAGADVIAAAAVACGGGVQFGQSDWGFEPPSPTSSSSPVHTVPAWRRTFAGAGRGAGYSSLLALSAAACPVQEPTVAPSRPFPGRTPDRLPDTGIAQVRSRRRARATGPARLDHAQSLRARRRGLG